MSLKETCKHMRDLLCNITSDLEKAENGNKAASQRVRTGTVKLEKTAKRYRKESIVNEKSTKGQRKPSKSAKAKKAKPAAKSAHKKAPARAKIKARPKAKSTSFRARQMSIKRASAKLPTRRFSSAR